MERSTTSISATRVAHLVGDFDRAPAYAGLAEALRLLIGDGRIPYSTKLPSERDLTRVLGVSRTTVTRAYAVLTDDGYAEPRQGSGTYTRVPGGRRRAHDRALLPLPGDHDAINLNCAAAAAPLGIASAYADAAADLPAHLGGHGYFPAGLPELQTAIAASYDARGLPTEPEQIMVTPGALSATSIVAAALTRPGDRVLVESPVYPNATLAIQRAGARLIPNPVDRDGWDLDGISRTLVATRPRLAYLIPDFQNPTGHLMSDVERERCARQLSDAGTIAVVDEAHQALALEDDLWSSGPRPFAAFSSEAITIGSASKSFWGGLRLGWIRAPLRHMERLTAARIGVDLGAPVMEQLVLTRLLGDADALIGAHRVQLRRQRDALADAVRARLPDWEFVLPRGGLALWCHLPVASGSALARQAEAHGVIIAPGPVFAVDGGLDEFVRIPWTHPPEDLVTAIDRLAEAWDVVGRGARPARPARRTTRVIVA